ncbi:MAG: glycosyltransferase family 2 protein [Deferrisomatales bacterium]|nr:glycosyltransferase family 2 protein [Deferrisomatales bacterium]
MPETEPISVSVIVPCRNERLYVEAFIDSVLSQDLDGLALRIIVADGQSDDGTCDILATRAALDPRIELVCNPEHIVSTGLNRAIAAATSEYIVRMDVHTRYAHDYIRFCIDAIRATGADCVGGPWRAIGTTGVQLAIACAFHSRFGSGGAASRLTDFSGDVDTVYLGCWRRDTLVAFGGFDEALVRNQDDELCLRIKLSNGRIWQDSRIRSEYYPRDSYKGVARQFFQYGYWKPMIMRKHRLPSSARQLVPVTLILVAAGLMVGTWFSPAARTTLACLTLLYTGVSAISAIAATRREDGGWRLVARTMIACAVMQFAYGAGYLRGITEFLLLRRTRGAATMQTLTR